MKAIVTYNDRSYTADLRKPIDISLPISATDENPIAWYVDKPQIEPVRFGDWIGEVRSGASTNFRSIHFNPHGHGTHTECLGHITREDFSINKELRQFMFFGQLITVSPEAHGDDRVITREKFESMILPGCEALIIRTLPNEIDKRSRNYSNTNPPYLDESAAIYIREKGIRHLLIDLPSVDRERDDGRLLSHKAFWNLTDTNNVNPDARFDCTITEMIFADEAIADGIYLLNLQIASFENDASPSKPVLFELKEA